MTLKDLIIRYSNTTWGTVRKGQWRKEQARLLRFADWAQPRTSPTELVSQDIRDFMESLAVARYSDSHMYQTRNLLFAFWEYLIDSGEALWNPVYRVKVASPKKKAPVEGALVGGGM